MNVLKKMAISFSVLLFSCFLIAPAFAQGSDLISESEVQSKVEEVGKETVSGNVFVWFLCAVAFLKVSQKIDSFMGSLGVNVGHTGGSLLAEAMIAARGITSVKNIGTGAAGFSRRGSSGTSGAALGALSGGLAGVVSRQFHSSAVKQAAGSQSGGIGSGVSGQVFQRSMDAGGNFANGVIGSIAKGSIEKTGSMTGENAARALHSYLGYTGQTDAPSFRNVEIGGGRIHAIEISADHPNGIEMGMYSADQYVRPEGDYSMVETTDGSVWYQQYAIDAVKREPYMEADGNIAYNESLIQKMPEIPRRKDRL